MVTYFDNDDTVQQKECLYEPHIAATMSFLEFEDNIRLIIRILHKY